MQPLEDRTVPASIVVNSTADLLYQAKTATISTLQGSKISLRDAINIANNTPGADTIVLAAFQSYSLNSIDNYWYGPNGMPVVKSQITINGNGATIERVGGPNFRLFYVSGQNFGGLPAGNLTLRGLTMRGGVAEGGDSYYGGGGLGAGGAIFNQGTLVLDSVLMTGNTANGGTSGYDGSSSVYFGAGIGQDNTSRGPGGFGGSVPLGSFPNGIKTREGQGGSSTLAAGFGGGGYGGTGAVSGFGGGAGTQGTANFGGGASLDSYYGGGGAGLGGAVFNRGGNVTIVNSTLTGNAANGGYASYYSKPGDAFGGAIFNLNGSVRLTNDTITGNTLSSSGKGYYGLADGLQVYNLADSLDGKTVTATLTIANTILSGASSGLHDVVNQLFVNAGAGQPLNRAIIQDAANANGTPSNIISTAIANFDSNFENGVNGPSRGDINVHYSVLDPMLQSLANNGGWSWTMALSAGSPARNAGLSVLAVDAGNKPLVYDQRGSPTGQYLRVQEGSVDIGAIEMEQLTLLDRLGYFDGTQFSSLSTAHTITNSTLIAKNVYVISHGWMPGYADWVADVKAEGRNPLTWDTWQVAVPASPGASTPWLYLPGDTTDPAFQINPLGLAQAILKVDPNATVLAYSWIDDSATSDFIGIPEEAYLSEGRTVQAGLRLAEGLMEALAPDYSQGLGKVHLIGHSHGVRVATVATLALQQAALKDPKFNVVRQLTLLDSPEDNGLGADSNPINIDAANYDWFYLSQLNMPGRRALSGAVTNGSRAVFLTGDNIRNIRVGDGVTGPGVPVGTTLTWLGPVVNQKRQALLSAPVRVPTGKATVDLGFWDWRNAAVFVDSYHSYFGSDFSNFVVNSPDQGINKRSLYAVVDVALDADAVFHNGLRDIGLRHEYAANWYAGTDTTGASQSGLLWSPLVLGATLPSARSVQSWASVDPAHQFLLTALQPASALTPSFDRITDITEYSGTRQGNVNVQMQNGVINGLVLSDQTASVSSFSGYFYKRNHWDGFSFDYSFTGGTDGAKLQIWMNGDLYFEMEARAAVGLPGSGKFSATFGLALKPLVCIRTSPSSWSTTRPAPLRPRR
ncbi:MAG: choice-of-anchor Q domain-containing protein [Gemmatales bacterium]